LIRWYSSKEWEYELPAVGLTDWDSKRGEEMRTEMGREEM